jgi:membrane protease YdiL (CAAX protease family)
VAWTLRDKATMGAALSALAILVPLASRSTASLDRAVSFIFYLFFLGPGEEILFRGYIQSRLNQAFGRPFRLYDVNWGWGLIITSLLFAVMHVLNPFNPFLGELGLYWWWGVSFYPRTRVA